MKKISRINTKHGTHRINRINRIKIKTKKIIKNAAHMVCIALPLLTTFVFASNIIPEGRDNNELYYKIGGARDFAMPPVSDTSTINLDTNTNLGLGLSCGNINPSLSIMNTFNDLRTSGDDLAKNLIASATGSLILMPGYLLAKANPSLYALFNDYLLSSHKQLDASIKSCQAAKEQIADGQNPYQDWGKIAVGDQWNKKLTLISSGNEDINKSKKEIEANPGDDGVKWVKGKDINGAPHAGGVNQPPIHVIADTVKAGYNALLNRSVDSDSAVATTGSASELANYFSTPKAAEDWITNVVGDQIITTCVGQNCKVQNNAIVGHGLLPYVTSCTNNHADCTETIKINLANMVSGYGALTKNNLEAVSSDGIAISPDIIVSIRTMDSVQQSIVVNKLAQEVSVQRVMNKALIARNILATGAQVPVIAANHPAQTVVRHAIENLDQDIHSIAFESQVRKQMVSNTLSQIMTYSKEKQTRALSIPTVSATQPIIEQGAIAKDKDHHS